MSQGKNSNKVDCHSQSNSAKKKQGRCTSSEHEQRVKIVFNLLLESRNRGDILEFVSNSWGLGRASADLLIHSATQKIIEIAEAEKASSYSLAILQLESMLAQCLEAGDIKTALSVRRELSELQQLKSANTVTVNANSIVLSSQDRELL